MDSGGQCWPLVTFYDFMQPTTLARNEFTGHFIPLQLIIMLFKFTAKKLLASKKKQKTSHELKWFEHIYMNAC